MVRRILAAVLTVALTVTVTAGCDHRTPPSNSVHR